jgi:hypothetical protein
MSIQNTNWKQERTKKKSKTRFVACMLFDERNGRHKEWSTRPLVQRRFCANMQTP